MSKLLSALPDAYTPALLTVWREGYSKQQFFDDFLAGLIVGVVALPLAIAFGIASGVTPIQGLVTAIFSGFITALLGGSRTQVSGPTGAFIVILYGIVQKYGVDGLTIATIIAGCLLILLGLLRAGAIIQFIPFPVITGFTSGIAVIIATGQIPAFLGLQLSRDPAEWIEKIQTYAAHIPDTQPWTLVISLFSLGLVAGWPKLANRLPLRHILSKLPGSLIAIVLTTCAVKCFHLPVLTIGDKFGAVPGSIPAPRIPHINLQLIRDMFQPAITIAMLAGIESLLSAVVADGMTGHRHKSNMELIAHGVANLVSPIFGGIPSTGAIARTATNIRNGGRTPVAAIVHALTLLLIVLFFGQWATWIPLATLSGILLMVAYNMSEWHTFIKILRAPKSDIAVLLTTFFLTILVDLTVAIEVGVMLAALLFIKRMSDVAQIRTITSAIQSLDTPSAKTDRPTQRIQIPGVVIYEIYGQFFFGAMERFRHILSHLDQPTRVLILEMRTVLAIDSAGLMFLENVVRRCQKENIRLILCGLHMQPTIALTRAGILEQIGENNIVANLQQALQRAQEN